MPCSHVPRTSFARSSRTRGRLTRTKTAAGGNFRFRSESYLWRDTAWRRRRKAEVMSKSRIGTAVAAAALIAVGVLPSAAEAGIRLRVGGPVGVARFAMASMLSVAGLRHARMAARHRRAQMAALRPQDLQPAAAPIRPSARAQLTAVAALAGWQGGRAAQVWCQHADGSYGWLGPLFWPFA